MLRILTYHRVAHPCDYPWLQRSLISATPEAFNKQMRYIKTHYNVVAVEQVLDAAAGGKELPKRPVLITFDDGYADFGAHAWPILKQHRLPATLFVPTAYPDDPHTPFWWDRLYHAFVSKNGRGAEQLVELRRFQQYLKTIPHPDAMRRVDGICAISPAVAPARPSLLDWDQLRRLAKEGVAMGSHTRTHPVLTQIPVAQVREEIRASTQDLRRRLDQTLPIFCYPSGFSSDGIAQTVSSEGIRLAFSTLEGQNNLRSTDLLRLRRTSITMRTTLPLFRIRLSPVGSYIDAWRQRA